MGICRLKALVTNLYTGSIVVPLCYFKSTFLAHIEAICFKSSINWFENSPALSTKTSQVPAYLRGLFV